MAACRGADANGAAHKRWVHLVGRQLLLTAGLKAGGSLRADSSAVPLPLLCSASCQACCMRM